MGCLEWPAMYRGPTSVAMLMAQSYVLIFRMFCC